MVLADSPCSRLPESAALTKLKQALLASAKLKLDAIVFIIFINCFALLFLGHDEGHYHAVVVAQAQMHPPDTLLAQPFL